jgi:hypothetical protein
MRRECPYCEVGADEPAPEIVTEWTDDGGMKLTAMWRTVLPFLAAHVVIAHPGTPVARELLRMAEEHCG